MTGFLPKWDAPVRDLRLAAAIYWYQKSEISQEKAATIAGLNRRDFIEALTREQVDVFVVDFDDLQRKLYHFGFWILDFGLQKADWQNVFSSSFVATIKQNGVSSWFTN